MKYINYFDTLTDYTAVKDTLVKPNVNLILDDFSVYYNKKYFPRPTTKLKSELELDNWYLIDSNLWFYKVELTKDSDGVVTNTYCPDYEASKENATIIGVAYKWSGASTPQTQDNSVGEQIFAIALDEIPNASHNTVQLFPFGTNCFTIMTDMNQRFTHMDGYERTNLMYDVLMSANISDKTNNFVYKAYHYFDEYEGVQGYIGTFGQYLYVLTQLTEELNGILEAYGGTKVAYMDGTERHWHWVTSRNASSSFFLIAPIEGENERAYINYSTADPTRKIYNCRPMIYLPD